MDRKLSNATFGKRFVQTAQTPQAASDQVGSAAPQEPLLRKPILSSDTKYQVLWDEKGNRHLVKEGEMRDGKYPGSPNRTRELFLGTLATLNKIVVQGHYNKWERGLATMKNPENVSERVNLLLQIQTEALEAWRHGEGEPAQAPKDDGPKASSSKPFGPDKATMENLENVSEQVNLLLPIQKEPLEALRLGEGVPTQAPKNDGPKASSSKSFGPDKDSDEEPEVKDEYMKWPMSVYQTMTNYIADPTTYKLNPTNEQHLSLGHNTLTKEFAPKKSAPKESLLKEPVSKELVPKKFISKKPASKEVIPKKLVPKELSSKEPAPKELVPKKLIPKDFSSKEPTPKVVIDLCSPEPESASPRIKDGDNTHIHIKNSDGSRDYGTTSITKITTTFESYKPYTAPKDENRGLKRARKQYESPKWAY